MEELSDARLRSYDSRMDEGFVSVSDLPVSASEGHYVTQLQGGKVTLTFSDLDNDLLNAYQSVFNWIDPDIPVFETADTIPGKQFEDDFCSNHMLQIPSLAIVFFLKEDDENSDERITRATRQFESEPWRFHHSEWISRGNKSSPLNNQDYYQAGDSGPLFAARQIPGGKQIIRIVRFVEHATWEDTVSLYSLILGQEPEVSKPDFCLYTTGSTVDYYVQFALKRAPRGIACASVQTVRLNFRINYPGHIVPLLPHVCLPTYNNCWQSRDYDGNLVVFEAVEIQENLDYCDMLQQMCTISDAESDMLHGTLEPLASDSVLSDSTINAFSSSEDERLATTRYQQDFPKLQRDIEGREAPYVFEESYDLGSKSDLYCSFSPNFDKKSWQSVSHADSGHCSHSSETHSPPDSQLSIDPFSRDTTVSSSDGNENNRSRLTRSPCDSSDSFSLLRCPRYHDEQFDDRLSVSKCSEGYDSSFYSVSDNDNRQHSKTNGKFLNPKCHRPNTRDKKHFKHQGHSQDVRHDRQAYQSLSRKKKQSGRCRLDEITDTDLNLVDMECLHAYESIEKDIAIINDALYGSSHSNGAPQSKFRLHKNKIYNNAKLGFYV